MYRQKFLKITILVFFLIFFASADARTFTDFYYFGDSNLDIGNLVIFGGQPNWTTSLNDTFHKGELRPSKKGGDNYAYGIAKTGHNPNPSLLFLQDQVQQLLKSKSYRLDPQAIYVIWIGASNILYEKGDINTVSEISANEIKVALQMLYDAGARIFVFQNVENISDTPLGRKLFGDKMGKLTRVYNTKVAVKLNEFVVGKNIIFIRIDEFALFDYLATVATNPEIKKIYGLEHMIDGTCNPGDLFKDCSKYFFSDDGMHMNARGYQIIADQVAKILKSPPYNFQ